MCPQTNNRSIDGQVDHVLPSDLGIKLNGPNYLDLYLPRTTPKCPSLYNICNGAVTEEPSTNIKYQHASK